MPEITEITTQKNNADRCNLFVDGVFCCGLLKETAFKYSLKKGLTVSEEELKKIIEDDKIKQAFSVALSYVAKALKTKRQVKDYLLKKGYDDELSWKCVDKLKEYGYVDDVEYSKRYIESVGDKYGRKLIEFKLMQKGVRKDDICAAYDAVGIREVNPAVEVAKKYLRNKEKTKENISKTYRYLVGKGFSYDEINDCMSILGEDE